MGGAIYLPKADTTKEVHVGEGQDGRAVFGVSAMRGWRRKMEDAHIHLPDFQSNLALFAVFDGHGGPAVSALVAKKFPGIIAAEISKRRTAVVGELPPGSDEQGEVNYAEALRAAFIATDRFLDSTEGREELRQTQDALDAAKSSQKSDSDDESPDIPALLRSGLLGGFSHEGDEDGECIEGDFPPQHDGNEDGEHKADPARDDEDPLTKDPDSLLSKKGNKNKRKPRSWRKNQMRQGLQDGEEQYQYGLQQEYGLTGIVKVGGPPPWGAAGTDEDSLEAQYNATREVEKSADAAEQEGEEEKDNSGVQSFMDALNTVSTKPLDEREAVDVAKKAQQEGGDSTSGSAGRPTPSTTTASSPKRTPSDAPAAANGASTSADKDGDVAMTPAAADHAGTSGGAGGATSTTCTIAGANGSCTMSSSTSTTSTSAGAGCGNSATSSCTASEKSKPDLDLIGETGAGKQVGPDTPPHLKKLATSVEGLEKEPADDLDKLFQVEKAEEAEMAGGRMPLMSNVGLDELGEDDDEDSSEEGIRVGGSFDDLDFQTRSLLEAKSTVTPEGQGCTANVLLLEYTPNPSQTTTSSSVPFTVKAYCANAGDSRSVLCRNGEAIGLSEDHKPTNPGERARIVASGGTVSAEGRVDSNLNLSRALGDLLYKDKALEPENQRISGVPDVSVTTLTSADNYIVMGCDGLFEKESNESLVHWINTRLQDARLDDVNAVDADEAGAPAPSTAAAEVDAINASTKDCKNVAVSAEEGADRKPGSVAGNGTTASSATVEEGPRQAAHAEDAAAPAAQPGSEANGALAPATAQGKKQGGELSTLCSRFLDYNVAPSPEAECGQGCDNMSMIILRPFGLRVPLLTGAAASRKETPQTTTSDSSERSTSGVEPDAKRPRIDSNEDDLNTT